MKLAQISKRIVLFVVVNLLVLITLSIVMAVIGNFFPMPRGSWQWLALFSLILGFGGAFISLGLSRIIAKWSMGVKVIDPDTRDPELQELVESVHQFARRAGLPKLPEVGVYESAEVNAFATGPSKSRSLVAVSTGLLREMNKREVDGVLAHEVAHIANGDMVTMTLVQGIINAFVIFLSRALAFAVSQALRSRDDRDNGGGLFQFVLVIVFEILFTFLGMIVVCAFSRRREFRADAGGLLLAGKDQMIGALRALQRRYGAGAEEPAGSVAVQSLKISGKAGGMLALFMTHPPLEERIARLESLGR